MCATYTFPSISKNRSTGIHERCGIPMQEAREAGVSTGGGDCRPSSGWWSVAAPRKNSRLEASSLPGCAEIMCKNKELKLSKQTAMGECKEHWFEAWRSGFECWLCVSSCGKMRKLIWRFDFLIREIGVGISPWGCWILKIGYVCESWLTLDSLVLYSRVVRKDTQERRPEVVIRDLSQLTSSLFSKLMLSVNSDWHLGLLKPRLYLSWSCPRRHCEPHSKKPMGKTRMSLFT